MPPSRSHRRPGRISGPAVGVLLGVVIALAVPAGWYLLRDRPDGRVEVANPGTAVSLAARQPDSAGPTTASVPAPSSARTSAASASPGAPPVSSASTAASPRPAGADRPRLLAIPDIGVSAPIDPIGVDASGEVAVPEDVRRIGWYRFGPAPGASAGSIVLVGHVDSAVEGTGAFFTLHTVRIGADVAVTTSDGVVHHYRVRAREEFPKTSVPLAALFARTGSPRLTLITCGGSFDATARSYRDNIVITATPDGATG